MIAIRLTSARMPITGSEKKNTAVAPGAVAPRKTTPTIRSRSTCSAAVLFVITLSAVSPR
jgi:hypothetical protein